MGKNVFEKIMAEHIISGESGSDPDTGFAWSDGIPTV